MMNLHYINENKFNTKNIIGFSESGIKLPEIVHTYSSTTKTKRNIKKTFGFPTKGDMLKIRAILYKWRTAYWKEKG